MLFEYLTIKTCPHCGATKPLVEFPKSKSRKDGYGSWCKLCAREASYKWRRENPDKAKEASQRWINENKEKVYLSAKEWKDKNRDWVNEYARIYYQQNKESHKESVRRWLESNPDYARNYRLRNPDTIKEIKRRYYLKNKDVRGKSVYLWRQNNPDKARVLDQNNRARRKGAEGKHTAQEVRCLFSEQSGYCFWCNAQLINPFTKEGEGRIAHLDHVIPLKRGGSNWISNLRWACKECNLSKGSKLPSEWNGSGGKTK